MRQYSSPNGHLITGTADKVFVTASIYGFDENNQPVYAGGSEVHWDTQVTLERDGKPLFVCENGDEWTFDQLVLNEEQDG